MNDRQAEFISLEVDRLMDEAGGDGWLALRLSVVERLMVSGMVSTGFARVAPVAKSGLPAKTKAPSIEDLKATDPEAASPL